ncbi:hypothetical protein TIFTF001_051940, partial [Ficus carica]
MIRISNFAIRLDKQLRQGPILDLAVLASTTRSHCRCHLGDLALPAVGIA